MVPVPVGPFVGGGIHRKSYPISAASGIRRYISSQSDSNHCSMTSAEAGGVGKRRDNSKAKAGSLRRNRFAKQNRLIVMYISGATTRLGVQGRLYASLRYRKMKCTNEVPCVMREHIDARIAFWLSAEAKWMPKNVISDNVNVHRNARCKRHASVSASNS